MDRLWSHFQVLGYLLPLMRDASRFRAGILNVKTFFVLLAPAALRAWILQTFSHTVHIPDGAGPGPTTSHANGAHATEVQGKGKRDLGSRRNPFPTACKGAELKVDLARALDEATKAGTAGTRE